MRVAYVGNFRHLFCTEVHVKGSLELIGHEVFPLQEDRLDWSTLPGIVARRRCDLLMWTRTWEVDRRAALDALDALRDAGIPTISFHLDRFHGLAREYLIELEPFFRTDLLVTPDAGPWVDYGVRAMWLPPGVYGPEARGRYLPAPRRFPHDVVFVGSHPYPHPEWQAYRTGVIERMRAEFGDRFGIWPRPGQPIRGRQLGALYASAKVVVGDSCLAGGPSHYWSDRIPETIGRGGFLVHPDVPGLGDWYRLDTVPSAKPFATYTLGDLDELSDIVHTSLELDAARRQVAGNGRAFALEHDTYEERMRVVIAQAERMIST